MTIVGADRRTRGGEAGVWRGQSLCARARVRDRGGHHARRILLEWHRDSRSPEQHHPGRRRRLRFGARWKRGCAQAFASGRKGPAAKEPEIGFDPAKPGYYLVEKTDVNQSNIQMVALGTTRTNPDYYAISVFNEAFGGGFSSRLFGDIRTTKGLAYAVGGGIGTAWDHPGMLRMDGHEEREHGRIDPGSYDEEIADLQTDPHRRKRRSSAPRMRF